MPAGQYHVPMAKAVPLGVHPQVRAKQKFRLEPLGVEMERENAEKRAPVVSPA